MAAPPPLPTTDSRHYQCPWCRHQGDASSGSCPACGAPVDVRIAVTRSGWSELPPIKDMAKIQFGQSFVQIEGKYVPVADFKLAQGDGVYFAHHLLLWKDDGAQISAMSLKSGWKRLFAGMPLVMTQAMGPGRIAFSKDKPGEVIALPLDIGQAIDVREHVFMVATHSVGYDWFQSGMWFVSGSGKERETHYPIGMFMDRFTATTAPGLLLLHGAGNIFVRTLNAGETILIKPTSLLFKEPSVAKQLHFELPGGTWSTWRAWNQQYTWMRMTGPGRVAVQSNFEPMEESGNSIVSSSPNTTMQNWAYRR